MGSWIREIGDPLIKITTLPYYRLYSFNTIQPLRRIANLTAENDPSRAVRAIGSWRRRKLAELQFVTISCTLLAGAVIGSFSWTGVESAYWLAPALWYCSLILSILGTLIAAQSTIVLRFLGSLAPRSDMRNDCDCIKSARKYLPLLLRPMHSKRTTATTITTERAQNAGSSELGVWTIRWKMVFVWQCPVMFMSYSVCSYLAGLTMLVSTPLIRRDPWDTPSTVAVVYLTTAALTGGAFTFCAFWTYHYVDFEDGDGDQTAGEDEIYSARAGDTVFSLQGYDA